MLDVVSQRKAPGGERAECRLTPHGKLSYGSGDVECCQTGFTSRRQYHAQPSLAPTKDVNYFTHADVKNPHWAGFD